ncbi:DEP domain-containing mTOR-interacting protein isoform X5 [Phyllopteryx taeniolatus]|uniref:DEP domain-containing mTOR-interacting protein isoform X5 n=1 Tax=Phyllopteryx taeniolatus TaxID=161469 RepID=UPI002AD3F059|nr:DEP domain-containing mTOR-interacting protein isoform X5 [Phyllopteryx taeniolatus]
MVFEREMDGIANSMQKKAAELERLAEVLVTGEQLRLRLHEGKVIKDRRHHLRTYPNCFVGKELIDWLIEHKEASERETAIKIMQKLLDQSIIHHVCDEHREFKDMKLLYRFRKDDGTFPLDNEAKVFMRGQRIYEKLMNTENSIIQSREEEGGNFERTVVASEFIEWLLQEGEMATREEAEQLGRRLLEHGIIQHVQDELSAKAAVNGAAPRAGSRHPREPRQPLLSPQAELGRGQHQLPLSSEETRESRGAPDSRRTFSKEDIHCLPVCGVSKRTERPRSGLQNGQQPDPYRTQDNCHGSHGGDMIDDCLSPIGDVQQEHLPEVQ